MNSSKLQGKKMESSSVSQKLRCSEFTLELSRALVVSEGDTSTLESDSPFWEAHVACAGEMDAGSILVTRLYISSHGS